ncbi:MAG: hypothetical protein ACLVGL_03950 [Waltera sp.]
MTFSHIFWAIGAEQQVSPFHLAARVYQEQGQGTSPLISGNYPGYEGYYNYFNISASGSTNEQVITNGLNYARNNGWDNAYASILGGANVISANYIKKDRIPCTCRNSMCLLRPATRYIPISICRISQPLPVKH